MRKAPAILTDDVQAAGAATWWSLSGSVPYDELAAAWAAAGLDRGLLPNQVQIGTALHRAVADCAEKHLIPRALPDGDGWALVMERADAAKDGGERRRLRYQVEIEARVVQGASGAEVEVAPAGHPLARPIIEGVAAHQAVLLAMDIGKWLVRMAEMLSAVPLRSTGGFYFIPRESLQMWQVICKTIESAAPHTVWQMPALKCDEAIAAIMASVEAEVQGRAKALREEVETGDLGERALRTRLDKAREATSMVHSYRELLGDQVVGLVSMLDTLYADIGAAIRKLEADAPALDPSVAIEAEAPRAYSWEAEREREVADLAAPIEVKVQKRTRYAGGAK